MGDLSEIVLLDMDGVIANFVQGLIDSHYLPMSHDDYSYWDYYKEFDLTTEQMWKPTYVEGWWESLGVYEHAHQLCTFLRQTHKIVFCTSPSGDYKCASEKILWLRENGFMSWYKNDYQIGPNKELNAKSGIILIDDSDDNRKAYEEQGGKFILFPQPWNENREHSANKLDYVKQEFRKLTGEK